MNRDNLKSVDKFKVDINEIKTQLSQNVNKDRYEHCMRVAETARSLSLRFNLDADKAYIAGLLHDCAKDIDPVALLKMAKEIGIEINEVRKEKPVKFLHSKVGAYIAQKYYGIIDKNILQAISYHHEGAMDMTSFDKIIALADMIEPNRKFADIGQLRLLLETSIDKAYFCAYKDIIVNCIKLDSFLEDDRIKIYNHLLIENYHL